MTRAHPETLGRLSPDGRWGGAVTRRALPPSDEALALAPAVRARLASIWMSQAATEARVARSFQMVHESLTRLDVDPALAALAARAVDDEHRHAALCEDLAGRYAGGPCGPHAALPHTPPAHPGASPRLRDALFVVGQCALNETFASAYLGAAYQGARTPIARAALRELLEDEIDHSRLGWAYLDRAPADLKRELSDWLVPVTICNLREWRKIALPDDDALAAHGVPPHEVAHAALSEALGGLLLPGFAHVGLDTRALERWIRQGAPVPELGPELAERAS